MFERYNLKGVGIDNFRVFGNHTAFKLAPITILTGTNSSGKSSFTKALNLLTRSYKANGLRKLDLMDNDLKLGGFESITNFKQNKKEISFELDIEFIDDNNEITNYNTHLIFKAGGLKSIKLHRNNTDLLLQREFTFTHNKNWDFLSVEQSFLKIPEDIISKGELRKLFSGLPEDEFKIVIDSIVNYLQNNVDAHTCKHEYYLDSFEYYHYDIIEGCYRVITDSIREIGHVLEGKRKYFDSELGKEVEYENIIVVSANPKLREILPISILEIADENILDLYLSNYLELDTLDSLSIFPVSIFKETFSQFEFIDGVRATQEIVYTREKTPNFFELLNKYNENIYSTHFSSLQKYIVDIFGLIKLDPGQSFEDIFRIQPIEGYGYLIQVKEENKMLGLASLGYGVTQLLPILLKIALSTTNYFVIEEPESNLHPALQSKLADFFVDALKNWSGFGERMFIIETHSEYLVRKLQFLVAKKVIAKEDIQIFYFNNPSNENTEEQIIDIQINDDGSLNNNFGTGFFDEADNIALELFLLTKGQRN